MSVAIITGATRGFGRALAMDLGKDRWKLVIDGRRVELVDETAHVLGSLGVEVTAIVGDVADEAHRSSLIGAAETFGGLDLLVNNASSLGPSPLPALEDFSLEDLRRVFEVNVFAPLALAQLALPMLRRRGGAIVAVSSDAAVGAYERWGGYGSSKAALDQLQLVLGVEQQDLRVYAFDPGDMRTDMHQAAFPGEDISDRPEPSSVVPVLRELLDSKKPSGRYIATKLAAS
jgi:NAD(P)-dependent dehydrogenase (short-subunit alcohol dehydrogenase family)